MPIFECSLPLELKSYEYVIKSSKTWFVSIFLNFTSFKTKTENATKAFRSFAKVNDKQVIIAKHIDILILRGS